MTIHTASNIDFRYLLVTVVVKLIVGGESDESTPGGWQGKEYLYSRISPYLLHYVIKLKDILYSLELSLESNSMHQLLYNWDALPKLLSIN